METDPSKREAIERPDDGLSEVVGRALVDRQFRELLYADPVTALAGYRLSAGDREAIINLPRTVLEEHALNSLAAAPAKIAIGIGIGIKGKF